MPNDVHADASFLELCSLGELTPGMPGVVGAEMHRRVMEMLQAFFPGREKDVLAQLNALGVSISGSSMVRILAPAAPLAAMPITDLDLFAPMASEVATRDLLERLGYVAQKRLPGPRFYSGNGDAGTQPVQTCLPGTRYYSGYGPSTCIEAAARHGHNSSSSWHKVSSGDEEAYSNKIPGTLTSAHKGYGSVDRTARAKNRSFSPGVCGVIKFMNSATGRWIDLVGCSLDARTVVSHFHSTAVQNWISNGKVSSNYPEHLHDGTTIFAISHYDQYHGSGLVKLKRKWEKYGSAYREGPAEQAHTRELHFDAPALSVAPSEQSATPQIEAASGRTCRYGRRIRARPPYDRC